MNFMVLFLTLVLIIYKQIVPKKFILNLFFKFKV